jgi:hypothetical protein
VTQEEKDIPRQQLYENISMGLDTNATTRELLEVMFSMRSMAYETYYVVKGEQLMAYCHERLIFIRLTVHVWITHHSTNYFNGD